MGKDLAGRDAEVRILEQYYQSDKSELVAVYGRRRVGKTYLIRKTLGDRTDYEFAGMYKASGAVQRAQFQKELSRLTRREDPAPADWFEAFDRLREYLLSLGKEKVVVFLDELPWMDTVKGNFLNAFSTFWNAWGREKVLLKLYVCGSATTWMVDKLIGDKGGLYGRTSRAIYLAPFTLYETERFLNDMKKMHYGREQILDAYMIFGGIPYYLDMLNPEIPFQLNIDTLFFSENAPLRVEYDFLYRSLFSGSENYRKVIEALSMRLAGLTREDISEKTKLSGGELSTILKNLSACDFIRIYSHPGKKERGRIYQLSDMFSLFHLRFVKDHDGLDHNYWTNASRTGQISAWAGYAFEQVCLHHIPQIKKALGISGILSNVYAWSCRPHTDQDGNEWKGGQIDLIIDRNDRVMNLCEIKYAHAQYTIDRNYAETIRERTELFRREQKTTKNLRCTFITTYGIKTNHYSGIVDHQVKLDDLFDIR